MGAETGELRTIELDEIIPSRMLIRECLQHLRGIIAGILGVLIAQQCDIAGFFFTSSCHCFSFLIYIFKMIMPGL